MGTTFTRYNIVKKKAVPVGVKRHRRGRYKRMVFGEEGKKVAERSNITKVGKGGGGQGS